MARANSKRPLLLVALVVVLVVAAAAVVAFFALRGDEPDGMPTVLPQVAGVDVTTGRQLAPPERRRAHVGASDVEPPAALTVRGIRGIVTDGEGGPAVPSAEVTLYSSSSTRRSLGSGHTGADGQFEIRRERGGDVTFFVRADGFVPESFDLMADAVGDVGDVGDEPVSPVRIAMTRGRETTVRVLDAETSAPIDGAEVTLHQFSFPDPTLPLLSVLTNAAGEAPILVAPGRSVYATAPGHLPQSFPTRSVEIVLALARSYTIAGVCVDDAGNPVAAVRVSADARDKVAPPVFSAADGTFQLDSLPAGNRDLWARRDGYVSVTAPSTAGALDARIVMVRGGMVSGRVLLPNGQPARRAEVNGVVVDDDGAFHIGPVPHGSQRVRATVASTALPDDAMGEATDVSAAERWPWGMVGSTEIEVDADTPVNGVEITVQPVPSAYAIVRIVDADGNGVRAFAQSVGRGSQSTREDGAIVVPLNPLEDERGGVTFVSADPTVFGRLTVYPALQATADGRATVIQLPRRTRLEVVIVRSESRSGDASPQVEVHNGEPQRTNMVRAQGLTAIFYVDPARSVWVGVLGNAALGREVRADELAAGRVELRDTGEATVTLRVVRPPGTVDGFWVGLLVGDAPPQGRGVPFPTDRDGSATLTRVPPGPARLLVMSGFAVLSDRPVVVPESGTLHLGTIEAPVAAVVRGVVRLPDGTPAGGAQVVVRGRAGAALSYVDLADGNAAADGTFAISLLPGADVQIAATRTHSGAAVLPWRVPGAAPGSGGSSSKAELKLRPECKARIRYRRPALAPYGASVVACVGPDRVPVWELETDDVTPRPAYGDERVLLMHGLPDGRVTFRLGRGDGSHTFWEADAVLTPEKIVEVDLTGPR